MALAHAASGIGKQVVTHAVRTWLGARRERDQRGIELVDLVKIGVRDHFQRRRLVRQLEDLADQIAERLRPVYEGACATLQGPDLAAGPARHLHDPVRRWELIQTEGALTWCLDGPNVMAGQMEHLLSVSKLRNVDLGIVHAFQAADFTASHGFHIYDIVTYATLFSRIADLTVRGDEAREILTRLAHEYRARA